MSSPSGDSMVIGSTVSPSANSDDRSFSSPLTRAAMTAASSANCSQAFGTAILHSGGPYGWVALLVISVVSSACQPRTRTEELPVVGVIATASQLLNAHPRRSDRKSTLFRRSLLGWAYLGSNQGPLRCERSALPLRHTPQN